jgi:hypothetical protein
LVFSGNEDRDQEHNRLLKENNRLLEELRRNSLSPEARAAEDAIIAAKAKAEKDRQKRNTRFLWIFLGVIFLIVLSVENITAGIVLWIAAVAAVGYFSVRTPADGTHMFATGFFINSSEVVTNWHVVRMPKTSR